MRVKISDYIAEFLVEQGIDTMFMVTGGGAMHLNDSFGHKKGLQCIYNHHEQACAIGAEAYTRLSGKLAAVCVTSGPGGTNTITGVLGGWLDSIPMLIISGQVKRETTIWRTDLPLRQLGDQEYNIITSVQPMTKYAKMVVDANEIAYHLEKAIYLCKNGRGGPVWLDIPLDIQATIIETNDLVHFNEYECAEEIPDKIDSGLAKDILDKLSNAKRPIIFAGSGIRLAGAHQDFLTLIQQLQIPVVTAWNAHDNLWDDHPLYCGRPGTVGTRGGNFVVENSDLILSLGCRLNIRQIGYNYKDFAKNAYKIIVDIDQAELDKPTLFPDIKVHADVADVINRLIEVSKDKESIHQNWLHWCKEVNHKYPVVQEKHYKKSSPINPYVFMECLFQVLKENDVIITGNGSACVCSFQAAYLKKGQRLFTNSGCASMGYGLPAALGASFSRNKDRVICIEGDGSIMMNLQELQTISGNQQNIKIFLLNNNGYHSIRQTQTNTFGGTLVGVCSENGVTFPEFEKIAEAFHLPYFKIKNTDCISQVIFDMLEVSGPAFCEVILDTAQNFEPKISSKQQEDGIMVSTAIDNMFPFLDEEEYKSNKL